MYKYDLYEAIKNKTKRIQLRERKFYMMDGEGCVSALPMVNRTRTLKQTIHIGTYTSIYSRVFKNNLIYLNGTQVEHSI